MAKNDIDIKVVGTTIPVLTDAQKRELEALALHDPEGYVVRLVELKHSDDARQFLERREALYQNAIAELNERIKKLQEPPLRDGIYLQPSPETPREKAIVGSGGGRMEVMVATDQVTLPKDLNELVGREVWINQDSQIVKIQPQQYARGEAAEVIEVLKDEQRLRVKGQGSDEIIVERLPTLRLERIEAGDSVRIHPALGIAFEKLADKEKKALELDQIPNVEYSQIGGLDNQIDEIREAIEHPYLYRQLYKDYQIKRPKGILLHGPPGCGKTMVAKAIANNLSKEIRQRLNLNIEALDLFVAGQEGQGQDLRTRYDQWVVKLRPADRSGLPTEGNLSQVECQAALEVYLDSQQLDLKRPAQELDRLRLIASDQGRGFFLTVNGPELLNKYVGETEYSIRRIFVMARKNATPYTPVVIFFDELESMFSRRGSGISSDIESTVVPQLLSEIDGMEELKDVVIIGASNRYDLIDPAVLRPGRLDLKIYVGRPNATAAASILSKYLTQEIPLAEDVLQQYQQDAEAGIAGLIQRCTAVIYSPNSYLQIFERTDRNETMNRQRRMPMEKRKPVADIISGALLENIVARAKRSAVRRKIREGSDGLLWQDLLEAVRQECEESKEQYISELQETRDIRASEAFAVEVYLDETPGVQQPAGAIQTRWFAEKTRAWLSSNEPPQNYPTGFSR